MPSKPFSIKEDLFDMDTFLGRYQHFQKLFNPKQLLYSNDQFKEFQANIDEFIATKNSKFTDEELWNQQYVIKSNCHPETNKPLPMIFRWSCFVPCNIPLLFGIGMLPPTAFNQAFFQSMNQAYNFGINVCNASASNPMKNTDMAISFTLAVSSALCVSVGFRKFLLSRKSENIAMKGLL